MSKIEIIVKLMLVIKTLMLVISEQDFETLACFLQRGSQMFKLRILHFYPLNELISNLIPATGLKKDSAGRTSSN